MAEVTVPKRRRKTPAATPVGEVVPDPAQLAELIDVIGVVGTQVESLKNETKRQSEAIDESNRVLRRARIKIIAAIVASLIGITVGGVGLFELHQADVDRAARSKASCLQSNDVYQNINGIVDEDENTFKGVHPGNSVSAKAFIAERIAAYEARRIPLRDCSPEGIERYLNRKK